MRINTWKHVQTHCFAVLTFFCSHPFPLLASPFRPASTPSKLVCMSSFSAHNFLFKMIHCQAYLVTLNDTCTEWEQLGPKQNPVHVATHQFTHTLHLIVFHGMSQPSTKGQNRWWIGLICPVSSCFIIHPKCHPLLRNLGWPSAYWLLIPVKTRQGEKEQVTKSNGTQASLQAQGWQQTWKQYSLNACKRWWKIYIIYHNMDRCNIYIYVYNIVCTYCLLLTQNYHAIYIIHICKTESTHIVHIPSQKLASNSEHIVSELCQIMAHPTARLEL